MSMKIEVWIDGSKSFGRTIEMCPICENEVELEPIPYKRQVCPNCKNTILACSACDAKDCARCQEGRTVPLVNLRHLEEDQREEWKKHNDQIKAARKGAKLWKK